MNPLVSILIPAYNAERYLADTLRSALSQTWPRKEIIVVNDGSRDATLTIARSFESKAVKVVTQDNQGAAVSRNRALELSQGDLIQWLDADDLLSPDKIEAQVRDMRGNRTLLSCAWGYFLHRPEKARFLPTELWADLSPADWLTHKLSLNLHMQTATWLVSRQLTEKAGAWNTDLLADDDGEYFCRVLMASDGVHFVPGPKVFYRRSGSSSLSYIGLSPPKIEAQWASMRLHITYLRSLEDSPRTRRACVRYINNWFSLFYPEYRSIVREAEQLAEELGGQVEIPRLSWKYAWIEEMLGWSLAKRVQMCARTFRWAGEEAIDRVCRRVLERVR